MQNDVTYLISFDWICIFCEVQLKLLHLQIYLCVSLSERRPFSRIVFDYLNGKFIKTSIFVHMDSRPIVAKHVIILYYNCVFSSISNTIDMTTFQHYRLILYIKLT